MQKYANKASDPTTNAEQNLMGRTHYVDPKTRKYFGSRIQSARPICGGLLFAIVESVYRTHEKTSRGYRPVIFDLGGNVIERIKTDETYKSNAAADKALRAMMENLDAIAITHEAIDRADRNHAREMAEARALLNKANPKDHNID